MILLLLQVVLIKNFMYLQYLFPTYWLTIAKYKVINYINIVLYTTVMLAK